MKRIYPLQLLILIVISALVSCSSPNHETKATETQFPTNIPTTTTVPSPTPFTKTGTPTPTLPPSWYPRSYYIDLPPGEYLSYVPKNDKGYKVISLDGQYQAAFYKNLTEDLSYDGKRVISTGRGENRNIIQIFDLVKGEYIEEITLPDCLWFYSWSPDEKNFAGPCRGGAAISIYFSESETLVNLNVLNASEQEMISLLFPIWSPDGEWIAYYRHNLSVPIFTDPNDGVYITNTICLEEPTSCYEHTTGPILPFRNQYKVVWSPNSRYLAMLSGLNKIYIYDFVEQEAMIAVDGLENLNGLTWSYDSTRIFFSQKYDIYMLRLGEEEPVLIKADIGHVHAYLEISEP
ncbi:MAG: WD40 repeat domain-containing protein [Chloroflexi bacterium]|nr:MAG: WD40 repeat domain-containing protein [Chloroflexota bacterium]MBL1193322.1 WD40 repeat domain-containing protein [Chloroflexota bacterium]NOH10614.1 WD40 repeat domain-containing protein [Chloroflexota bacterium]